jgi:hypothetical protein
MGSEYRKRIKEQYGRPSVAGKDILVYEATVASGAAAHTALELNGISQYDILRDANVDYVAAQLQVPLDGGTLEVAVHSAGTVIASGSFVAAGPKALLLTYNADKGNTVALASGSVVEAATTVAAGPTADHALIVRVGLEYNE